MAQSGTLAAYLEEKLGVSSNPRDLEEERRVDKELGLDESPLKGIAQSLSYSMESLGFRIQGLENLQLTNIPKGVGMKEINKVAEEYFRSMGYTIKSVTPFGRIFGKSNEDITFTSTYIPQRLSGDICLVTTEKVGLERDLSRN